MESTPVILVVGQDVVPEREHEANEWFEQVHMPMVLRCPGVRRASRYKLVEPVQGLPAYLTIYELANESSIAAMNSSAEMAAAREDFSRRFGNDLSVRLRGHYRQIVA